MIAQELGSVRSKKHSNTQKKLDRRMPNERVRMGSYGSINIGHKDSLIF